MNLINLKQHRAKKSLGQNFLTNPRIIQRIIDVCEIKNTDIILEIGPGKGAITRDLAKKAKQIIAVEADYDLAKFLEHQFKDTNVTVIHHDILKFDFNTLPHNVKIISNLPYNIATPILAKVIKHREHFTQFFMMVQLEYGQRMVAPAGNKTYGSFSCFTQYYGHPEILFKIGSSSFQPMPKVQSCFIKYQLYTEIPQPVANSEEILFKVIHAAFNQRRKTILNSLSKIFKKADIEVILKGFNIKTNSRAEELTLAQYIQIANTIEN